MGDGLQIVHEMKRDRTDKMGHPFVKRVAQTIAKRGMIQKGDAVLIGVSGGPDSVVLLSVLATLAPKYSLRLGIAHVNHCLRGAASDRDETFVESLARDNDMPCYTRKIDIRSRQKETGLCLEEAGRKARYEFFRQIAGAHRYDKIAVGHHADDDAELILLNLLRGSGCSGISGIPPKRDSVVRPLIDVSRNEIMSYIIYYGLKYRTDASNEDTNYLRNRVRHQLIPVLKEYNPHVTDSLVRIGNILRSEDEWTEALILPLFQETTLLVENRRIVLSVPALQKQHIAAVRRIIRKAVAQVKKDLRRISYTHIHAAAQLVHNAETGGRIDLPDRIRIARSRDRLIVSKEKKSLRSPALSGRNLQIPYEYSLNEPEAASGALKIDEIDVLLKFSKVAAKKFSEEGIDENRTGWIDWDQLTFPLIIRSVRPGDRFRPFGMEGSQKVNDFFCNNKVPAADRHRFPLLVSGSRIAWVAGFRIDDRAKVRSDSRFALKVEIFPAPAA